jgi:hypothetical protein
MKCPKCQTEDSETSLFRSSRGMYELMERVKYEWEHFEE